MKKMTLATEILTFLKSQRLMSLATSDSNKPQGSSVYYTVDDDSNLYFISEPKSRHIKNIIKNKFVACTVANSSQKVTDKKVGVQIEGTAQEVKGIARLKTILKMWNEANVGFAGVINYENIKNKAIKSKVYQIKPTSIKFFNEKLYGPEGTRTLEL